MTRSPALLLYLVLGKGAADDTASNASENATVPLCLHGSNFEAVPKDCITFQILTYFDFVVHSPLLTVGSPFPLVLLTLCPTVGKAVFCVGSGPEALHQRQSGARHAFGFAHRQLAIFRTLDRNHIDPP